MTASTTWFAPVTDDVLGAAARIFAERGFGGATLADIADAAEVSRSTLYRRYGTREELFGATVLHEVQPQVERSKAILASSHRLEDSLEELIVDAARQLPRNPCLNLLFTEGFRAADILGSDSLLLTGLREVLDPVLESAQSAGTMRPGLEHGLTTIWLVHQTLFLVTQIGDDEEQLREGVRTYLLPVLVPDTLRRSSVPADSAQTALDRLQLHLADAQLLVERLKQ